jgi:O-acetyl-ADP-ribose deacetylase (regulator of RNase III)
MTISFISRRRDASIFDAPTQVLVNPVNCVGTMGKGLAKAFAARFPTHVHSYQNAIQNGDLRVGHPVLVFAGEDAVGAQQPAGFLLATGELEKMILLFPTKDDWKKPSQLEWVHQGVLNMLSEIEPGKYKGIAFPALGCGLGGLDWVEIKNLFRHLAPQLEKAFGTVLVYEP